MTHAEILKEIELLEAQADSMKERCYKLRTKLGLVSTGSTSRKGKYTELSAAFIAKRNLNILKKQKR